MEATDKARLSAADEKVELPLEDQVSGMQGPSAPLAAEVFDEKVQTLQEVVAEVRVSGMEKKAEEQEQMQENYKPGHPKTAGNKCSSNSGG